MKQELRRESQHQYLVLSDPENTIDTDGYAYGMLRENRIPLLLPLTVHSFNGETLLYYEVSGKKSLSAVLSGEKTDKDLMAVILSSVSEVLDTLEEYLLGPDMLCTDPDCIFLDTKTMKLHFVCCPSFPRGFAEGMCRLSETLIGRLNHKDRDAVVFGYQFYQAAADGRVTSDFLRELIYQEKTEKTGRSAAAQSEKKKAEDYTDIYGKAVEGESLEALFLRETAGEAEIGETKKEKGFWKRIFTREKKEKTNRKRKQPEKRIIKETEEVQSFAALPSNEEKQAENADKEDYRTVLLQREPENIPFVVAWLIPSGLFGEISQALYEDEYLIGRKNGGAGICLNSQKVSRIHARLKRSGNTYSLADLSSVNGTFLNGRRMKSGEEVLLSGGDELTFGDAVFRFCLTADEEKEYT